MNRIPDCENVEDWAREMYHRGLAYHIDDDPAEIVDTSTEDALGPPLFSKEEVHDLRVATSNFSDEEREQYFRVVMEEVRKSNAHLIFEHPPCEYLSAVKKAE